MKKGKKVVLFEKKSVKKVKEVDMMKYCLNDKIFIF